MSYVLIPRMTYLRRRVMAVLVVALVAAAAALAAASTSAQPSLVKAHVARDGSIVVSGYDGGQAVDFAA
jgi:hypothetical protein